MRAIGWMLAAVALAGCSGEGMVRGGGGGLPEVAMRNSGDVVVPPGRVTTGLAVRTFVPSADASGWSEITGAQCVVTGGDFFRATVVTPVRLRVQDLGPDAPALRADCTSGTLTGAAAVAPGFGWPEEGRPGAVRRIWWGGGWWWGMQKTGPMRYGDLAVGMK